ncbi:MAG: inositol monophosphatase family protein [Candidatus Margulisiibacteriota bacterium]
MPVPAQTWTPFLHQLADAADDISRHYFKKELIVTTKADQSPVTQADREIETRIRQLSRSTHPHLTILGEEFDSPTELGNTTLIIDPIDGTRNFVRGLPFFATLLAIVVKNRVVAGLVSAPQTHDRWWAEIGQGSFWNSQPIHVSKTATLADAQGFHGSLSGPEAATTPASAWALLKKTARQRAFGDYLNHVLVAQGAGEFALDFGLKPWDIAPLYIIVEEAGGRCSDAFGHYDPFANSLITTNGRLHDTVIAALKENM